MRWHKYNAVPTELDGIKFDSKAEARRYGELELMKIAGEIDWFQRQPSFLLPGNIRYRPDFIVGKDNQIWLEDVKGMETQVFKIKKKQMAECYPSLELRVIK